MDPIKLRTKPDEFGWPELCVQDGLELEQAERIAHDLRLVHTHKAEINAALAIMPLVREWDRTRRLLANKAGNAAHFKAGEALSAALARVEEGEPCKECEGHKVIVVLGHSRSCPSCNGTGKEKPHA